MTPTRITLSRKKGWRLPADTTIVSRPSRWGNPYKVKIDGNQTCCARLFLAHWNTYPQFNEKDIIQNLRGRNLACWCKEGTPCHADVLLIIANDEDWFNKLLTHTWPIQSFWAPNTNISSQAWHGYINATTTLCGTPWPPMRSLIQPQYPGAHVACKQCSNLRTYTN